MLKHTLKPFFSFDYSRNTHSLFIYSHVQCSNTIYRSTPELEIIIVITKHCGIWKIYRYSEYDVNLTWQVRNFLLFRGMQNIPTKIFRTEIKSWNFHPSNKFHLKATGSFEYLWKLVPFGWISSRLTIANFYLQQLTCYSNGKLTKIFFEH